MKRKILFVMLIVMTVLVLMGTGMAKNEAKANAVRVEVFPDQVISEVKPNSIGGMNVNNAMSIVNTMNLIKPLKIATITYPAGNVADDNQMVDTNSDSALQGLYLQQKLLGFPFTFVQVRLFKGSPEMAAASVQRARNNQVKVGVWSIGNEVDLYAKHKNAPEWTPEKYNQAFREYALAMKTVDPNLKLAGPLLSQPNDSWIKKFITECGDLVDVLAWHWYPTDGTWSDGSALATAPFVKGQIERYRSWLKDPQINPKGYERDIKLAITEYALHWDTPNYRHLTDMVAAMWTAEVLGYMAQKGLDYSHFFCLGNYGGHALIEPWPSNLERPVYYVFKFYANNFGKKMVNADSTDAEVKVFASTGRQGRVNMILINQNPELKKSITIQLLKKYPVAKVQGYLLTEEISGEKIPAAALKISNQQVLAELPPYSVTALEISDK